MEVGTDGDESVMCVVHVGVGEVEEGVLVGLFLHFHFFHVDVFVVFEGVVDDLQVVEVLRRREVHEEAVLHGKRRHLFVTLLLHYYYLLYLLYDIIAFIINHFEPSVSSNLSLSLEIECI